MNFDELMAVWKSQDAAPLHDVNKTLLHETLRQDEARLQQTRRKERRINYATSAFVIGLLAPLFTLMIYGRQRYVMTSWDYVMGIGGAVAALLAGCLVYMGNRAQAQREQRFGESLRDQINRRLAQVDDVVAGALWRRMSLVLMGAICPLAILHLGMRVNHKTLGDVSFVPVALLVFCFVAGAIGLRRGVQEAAARRRELEALLKELDSQ